MELSSAQVTSLPNLGYPNLFDCNVTDIPRDKWSNLTDLGNNDGNVNLSENHITEILESITYSQECRFPVTAVNEFYTYDPITIQQRELHPLYFPTMKQYWD
ncbi:hypothetical protein [Listeria seeligeri]|uniref:hypothetical protein n=1 Tax=Listeria seeligeri TaxID=1640 RepID=UPI001E62C605|nr:hypothetical protein [Listeria seeligeri]